MDQKVAEVVSLLEGGVSVEEAREALRATHGSVEGALCRILDGRPAGGAAASSGSAAGLFSSMPMMIDLEESDDSGAASQPKRSTADPEHPSVPSPVRLRPVGASPPRQPPGAAEHGSGDASSSIDSTLALSPRPKGSSRKKRLREVPSQEALDVRNKVHRAASSSSSSSDIPIGSVPGVMPTGVMPTSAPKPSAAASSASGASGAFVRGSSLSLQAKPGKTRVDGYSVWCQGDTDWTAFPGEREDSQVTGFNGVKQAILRRLREARDSWQQVVGNAPGDHNWENQVKRRDPPCLTLRGHKLKSLPARSDGEVHLINLGHLPHVDPALLHCKWEGTNLQVSQTALTALFRGVIDEVRYLPAEMDFSWRVLTPSRSNSSGRRKHLMPPELKGALPSRPYVLLDNGTDPEAPQPPHFTKHKLRPEQLRSLSWMIAREGTSGRSDGAETAEENGTEGVEPFHLEWRSVYEPVGDDDAGSKFGPGIIAGALVKFYAGTMMEDTGTVLSTNARGSVLVRNSSGVMGTQEFSMDELELADTPGIQIGGLVQVLPSVAQPEFGWGGVNHSHVGMVLKIDGDTCYVNFAPRHQNWKCKVKELQRVKRADGGSGNDQKFALDLRVRVSYPVGGGILADKIGYGKTATTIALIDSLHDRPLPPIPPKDRTSFIPAKGTLIIVPSNLLDQWLGEISKFVWEGKNLKGKMKSGWSPDSCPLSIFAMTNVSPLTHATAFDLAQADIVLCSYRLLFSQIYTARRHEIGEGRNLWQLAEKTSSLRNGSTSVRSGRKGDTFVNNWTELTFPVLEMFYWRRVVFDEFHELESFESMQQNSLQHLRSHYRWGLTGTPPVDCVAGVIFMSSLFRIDLAGYLERPGTDNHPRVHGCPNLVPWESDRLLAETSQRFLDHFVRQNTAELPDIRLEEHVIVVHHTASERALYLGQAHDAPDFNSADAFANEDNVRALERLLKLCSHFQAGGDNVANAKEECFRIGEQKEKRLVKARNQLHRCARVINLFESKLQELPGRKSVSPPKWRAAIAKKEARASEEGDVYAQTLKEFAEVSEIAQSEAWPETLQILDAHKPRQEAIMEVFSGIPTQKGRGWAAHWEELHRKSFTKDELIAFLTAQAAEQAENIDEYAAAQTSYRFFMNTVKALSQDDSAENRSCVVCLEEGLPLTKLAITPCAHTFCMDCLKSTIEKFKSCSICRQPLTPRDACPLSWEMEKCSSSTATEGAGLSASSSSTAAASSSKGEEAAAAKAADAVPSENAEYGTKMARVVQKLKQIREEDPTAKVILFVQFDDLKKKVAKILMDCGIPAVQLYGSVSHRSNIIADWQNNLGSASFVLLLSLAQSASGTNLTAANHVVFLHPMLASTPERAIGHELQAIGRARRHGQKRDAVHVWRFVTADTLEQAITESHQAGLWERERAREALQAQAAPEPAPAAAADEDAD